MTKQQAQQVFFGDAGEFIWVDENGVPMEYAPGEREYWIEHQRKEIEGDEFKNRKDYYGF